MMPHEAMRLTCAANMLFCIVAAISARQRVNPEEQARFHAARI
jgi:hypothetical protein